MGLTGQGIHAVPIRPASPSIRSS